MLQKLRNAHEIITSFAAVCVIIIGIKILKFIRFCAIFWIKKEMR